MLRAYRHGPALTPVKGCGRRLNDYGDIVVWERCMRFDRALWVHVVVLVGVALLAAHDSHAESVAPARRAELVNMVRQDCGSCHGLTLKGGLGPALLPDNLAGKPDEALVFTVMHGRPGTAMPGWSRFVNDAEAAWIVARLKSGFPPVAHTADAINE